MRLSLTLVATAMSAAALSGCGGEAAAPARGRFPLAGEWVWSGGAPALPSRGVGCGAMETRMLAEAHALVLINGKWRQPAFTVNDWDHSGGKLVLKLEDGDADGRRKFALTLDVTSPDRTRVLDIAAMPGTSAAARREFDAHQTALREVFTLARCRAGVVATGALLRGSDGRPLAEAVARRAPAK